MDIIVKKVFKEDSETYSILKNSESYQVVEKCSPPSSFDKPQWIGRYSNPVPFICKNKQTGTLCVIIKAYDKQTEKDVTLLAIDNCKSIEYSWNTHNALIFIAEDLENKWHIIDGNLLQELSKETFDSAKFTDESFMLTTTVWENFIVKKGNKSSILNFDIVDRQLNTFLPFVEGDIISTSQYWQHGFPGKDRMWYINSNGDKVKNVVVLVVTKNNNVLTAHILNSKAVFNGIDVDIKSFSFECENFGVLADKTEESDIGEISYFINRHNNPQEVEISIYNNLRSGRLLFQKNGLWGVIKNGFEIIPPLFSKITHISPNDEFFNTDDNDRYTHSIYQLKTTLNTYLLDGIETNNAFANVKIQQIVDIKNNSSVFGGSLVKKLLIKKYIKKANGRYEGVPYSKEEKFQAQNDPNYINSDDTCDFDDISILNTLLH